MLLLCEGMLCLAWLFDIMTLLKDFFDFDPTLKSIWLLDFPIFSIQFTFLHVVCNLMHFYDCWLENLFQILWFFFQDGSVLHDIWEQRNHSLAKLFRNCSIKLKTLSRWMDEVRQGEISKWSLSLPITYAWVLCTVFFACAAPPVDLAEYSSQIRFCVTEDDERGCITMEKAASTNRNWTMDPISWDDEHCTDSLAEIPRNGEDYFTRHKDSIWDARPYICVHSTHHYEGIQLDRIL